MVRKTVKVRSATAEMVAPQVILPQILDKTAEMCTEFGGNLQSGICMMPEELATAKVKGLFGTNKDVKQKLEAIGNKMQSWQFERDAVTSQCQYVYRPVGANTLLFKTNCEWQDNLCTVNREFHNNLCE